MTATARLMPVVAMLLVALVDGSLSTGPASAEDNCLPAPNTPAPQGSHWHYRTDPVKQVKCWYLRTEGQVIQKPAARESPETDVATGSAATTLKTAPNQPGLEPMELRPTQTVLPTAAERSTKGSIPHGAQASRQAGTDKVAWPAPPSPAGAGKVAWPDPVSPARADKVPWPDPPSPAAADKVVWPDPPSRARGETPEVAWQPPPAAASTPKEKGGQTQQEPVTASDSAKKAGTDAGPNRHITEPAALAVTQNEMPISVLLALAAGLLFAGIIVRRIVKMAFARRLSVHPDVASERTIPTFVAKDRVLAHGPVDGDLSDDETREALRKLLLVLERQAV
jgi:hypothetical protein